jgi:hypothetical protein
MGRGNLEDLGVDDRIILKWIFKNWDGGMGWIYLAHDKDMGARACKCGNKPTIFTKCGESIEYVRGC